jgi:methionyl-tRNA formyltransferase
VGRGRIVKLAFLGTPQFAVPCLIRLQDGGHDIRLVVTQPDRPAGRGRRLHQSPVKSEALARSLEVFQPEAMNAASVERIASLGVDAVVVVAYGLILRPALLRLPPRGCINVHASLLPRYRGAAPVAHAILRGESRTGVTTLLMDEGIDTGPILLQRDCPIGEEETAGEVEGRLSVMGAALLLETLEGMDKGSILPQAQSIDRETYSPRISADSARIPWSKDAPFLARFVRAMNPRPGATVSRGSRLFKVWRASVGVSRSGEEFELATGTVLPGGRLRVACGEAGSVDILEMQMEGRRRVTGEEALRGRWLLAGDRFDEGNDRRGKGEGAPPPSL